MKTKTINRKLISLSQLLFLIALTGVSIKTHAEYYVSYSGGCIGCGGYAVAVPAYPCHPYRHHYRHHYRCRDCAPYNSFPGSGADISYEWVGDP